MLLIAYEQSYEVINIITKTSDQKQYIYVAGTCTNYAKERIKSAYISSILLSQGSTQTVVVYVEAVMAHDCVVTALKLATLRLNGYNDRVKRLEHTGNGSGIMSLNSPGGSTVQWGAG